MPKYEQGPAYEEDRSSATRTRSPLPGLDESLRTRRDELRYSQRQAAFEPAPTQPPEPAPTQPPEPAPTLPDDNDKKSLSVSPKIIAIGAVVGITIIGITIASIWFMGKRKKYDQSVATELLTDQAAVNGELYANNPELIDSVKESLVSTEESQPVEGAIDVAGETESASIPVIEQISYSDKELELLRKYGYTADEIEKSESLGLTARSLLTAAKNARESLARAELDKLNDTASPEYQELYYNSWLQGETRDLSLVDPSLVSSNEVVVLNLDYNKLPARGNQLWIRIKMPDETYSFMTVYPDRFVTMEDTGNIVVEVTYFIIGEEKYVVNLREMGVTTY